MKTIYLPPETTHVPFNAVDKIIAAAIYPADADTSARMFYAVNTERELVAAVRDGKLQVCHHAYHSQLPADVATPLLVTSLVAIDEFNRYVAPRGIVIDFRKSRSNPPQLAGNGKDGMGAGLVLNVEEVAAILNCEPSTVQEKARMHELPAVKFGRSWSFPVAALLEFLNSKARDNEQRKPCNPKGVTVSTQTTRQPPSLPSLPKTH